MTDIDYSNDRPSVQVDGTTIYLRASSLGKCVRALAAEIAGYSKDGPSEMLKYSAREGHLHEADMQKRIEREMGWILTDQQGLCIQEYEIGGWSVVVTGHYEGIWEAGLTYFLWENKSMSGNQYKLWKSSLVADPDGTYYPTFKNHPAYAWQISHYMLCNPGMEVFYTVKDRNMGYDTLNEGSGVFLKTPPFTRSEIATRLKQVISLVDNVARIEDPKRCSDDANRWQCDYRDILGCMDANTPGIEYEEVMDPELEEALILHVAAKKQKAAAERDVARARKVIDERVGAGAVVTMMGYTAKYGTYPQEDRAALEEFLKEHGKSLRDFKKTGKRLTTKGPK